MLKSIFFLFSIFHYIVGWEISNLTTPDIATALAPVWDDDSQSLYFVNLLSSGMQSSIFRYSYSDGIFYSAYIEGVTAPSFIMPVKDECGQMNKCNKCDYRLFAVGVDHRVLIIKWNGKSTKATVVSTLLTIEQDMPLSRMNFARADNKGRFYGGTFSQQFCNSTPSSAFYRYTKTAGVDLLFNGVVSSSGIVFNEDLNKMYQLDTCKRLISEFDWDPKTGDVCNGRVAFDFGSVNGPPVSPVDLEIDSFGFLYTSIYSGQVWKINPWTAAIADIYDINVAGVAGMAFGGQNRDILYVVAGSAVLDFYSTAILKQTTDGTSIFVIRGLGSMGQPSTSLSIKGKHHNCHKCGMH